MKRTLLSSFILLLIVACQKQNLESSRREILPFVKMQLRDSMLNEDYARLNFKRAVLMKMGNDSMRLLRIERLGVTDGQAFVLLQIDYTGIITQGRQVEITGLSRDHLQGEILIRSLSGEELVRSSISNGFVNVLHPAIQSKPTLPYSQEDPYREMPEVIIVCSYVNNQPSFSPWISLTGMFGYGSGGSGGGGGNPGAYYGPYNPSSGSGGYGGGSGGGTTEGVISGEVIKVDYENQYSDAAIDIESYMKCFSAIPDAGAVCSIEIFADLPVNGDPTKFFDWNNGSPGHVFIQLRKANGAQLATQNIGFYPKSGWKTTITPAPLPGKFVDNEKHEFNASLKISLNPVQLQTAITKILALSRYVQYDIDDYNCTDWALEVFNSTVKVSENLIIPRHDIPGGHAYRGTSTPQGIYLKLQEMKNAGGSSTTNISIPLVGWVGASKGACN